MSERAPQFESERKTELNSKEIEKRSAENLERLREAAEKAEAEKPSIEAIQERIEKAVAEKEKQPLDNAETRASDTPLRAGAQLKQHSYNQRIRSVQRAETPSERAFSKVIHQPVVEELSNIADVTVARPSGLLFGGVFSAVSSLVILYICKHYGYEYNFLIGLVFFIGGFAVGLLLEGAYRVFKRN